MHHIGIDHRALGLAAAGLPQQQQALDADGKTRRRLRLAAQLLDQTVVAPTGTDRTLGAQLIGTAMGVAWAVLGGLVVYGLIKSVTPLRLSPEEEYDGADLSIHKIGATPDREVNW